MADMPFVKTDGGRKAAGWLGSSSDCVCRAVTIASERPYSEVYGVLAHGTGTQRAGKGGKRPASARNGINTGRKWFKDYMRSLGFRWVPTMGIGTGCKVHLQAGKLPMGRLVVSVSKHYTCVLDGVIHDTHDPQRATITETFKGTTISHRCVYGYWILDKRVGQ